MVMWAGLSGTGCGNVLCITQRPHHTKTAAFMGQSLHAWLAVRMQALAPSSSGRFWASSCHFNQKIIMLSDKPSHQCCLPDDHICYRLVRACLNIKVCRDVGDAKGARTDHEFAVDSSPVQQDVLHAHVIDQVGLAQGCILLSLHMLTGLSRHSGYPASHMVSWLMTQGPNSAQARCLQQLHERLPRRSATIGRLR